MNRFNSTKQALRLEALEDRRVMSTMMEPVIHPPILGDALTCETVSSFDGDLIIDPAFNGRPLQGGVGYSMVTGVAVDYGPKLQAPLGTASSVCVTATASKATDKPASALGEAMAVSGSSNGHHLQNPAVANLLRELEPTALFNGVSASSADAVFAHHNFKGVWNGVDGTSIEPSSTLTDRPFVTAELEGEEYIGYCPTTRPALRPILGHRPLGEPISPN